MKTEKNILIAFILNLAFSVFEFVGGILTGSTAILSDAIHDVGDAAGIGVSWFLEKKSKKQPDDKYTYGYIRYSVIGSVLTTVILIIGSVAVICNAVERILNPSEINYNGMLIFAAVGVCINCMAAYFTHSDGSLNQKAVNLHMLEDVFGWTIVLIGAVIMKFTDFVLLDPIMSIGVSVFIFANALRTLKEAVYIFLEIMPAGIDINDLRNHICQIDGVIDVHHIHVWSMDEKNNYATMHIVTNSDSFTIKQNVREELRGHGICHATLELEGENEPCRNEHCHVELNNISHHHHHHHHH